MEIWHRVTFGHGDNVDNLIQSLGIKYKTNPLPGGGYLIHIDIEESESAWPELARLVRAKRALDMFDTVFNDTETLGAEWVRVIPAFEQGYPQPYDTWVTNPVNYENECSKCGAGYRQIAPFRLAKEPRMGKHHFLCLYWTYTLFCVLEVLDTFQANGILGYEVWDAIIRRTRQPSQVVRQLVFPYVADPGLAEADKAQPETCPQCGITKFLYHKRGYMHIRREALRSDAAFQLTHEWFGSGGHSGFREILASNRVARLILDKGWRGVRLKPIELV